MSVLITNIDTALFKIFIDEPLAQCAVSFINKCLIFIYKTLSGHLQELRKKKKSSWLIPKVVAATYRSSQLQDLFTCGVALTVYLSFCFLYCNLAACLD